MVRWLNNEELLSRALATLTGLGLLATAVTRGNIEQSTTLWSG